jgi:hypothetical protein
MADMNNFIRTSGLAPVLSLLLATGAAAYAAQAGPVQSQASYEEALRNKTTSPSYVLIILAGDSEESKRPLCTYSNFLVGAIMRETGVDRPQAEQIALDNREHVFRFTKQDALDNLPRRYSDADLADARALLAPFPVSELQQAFSSRGKPSPIPPNNVKREAIACALLERGLSPRAADISREIYVLGRPAGSTPMPNEVR